MSSVPRVGRLATLRQLLGEARYTSQAELMEALADHGITVSQPTLSKDLLELGAVRQRAIGGALVYARPPRRESRRPPRSWPGCVWNCCSRSGMRGRRSSSGRHRGGPVFRVVPRSGRTSRRARYDRGRRHRSGDRDRQ
ncbi:hypothetical protein G7085_18140 [Tessaracoccus sp. HDW20]|uniref:hypothetical protein n=1 Tax=Tessaracoccus coleopterorum TaxID=2714950 RepID=UPI002F919D92|nr:hypothetical protein [Tessaracoccus coleopterorum]